LNNIDVQLFWANDAKGNISIIYDLNEEDRKNKYSCPVCGSDVKPVAIGGKTKEGKVSQKSSHFSHFDASKCNIESSIHWWFKNKILVDGDNFIVKTDVDNEFKCKDVLIEQSYETEYGIYKPDITIITECGKTIYFEMNYTNKKKVEDYHNKWLTLGNIVVEVDLKTLMEASYNKNNYEFKALYYKGKCFNQNKNDLYYNTIGIHKENILQNNPLDDSIRERIKKLDWFWMEVLLYKKGESDIESLTDLIDYTEKEDKEIIFAILAKKRCIPLYEDYIDYKVELFEKLAENCLNNISNQNYVKYFSIEKAKNGRKYKNINYNSIILNNKYLKSNYFEVNKFSINEFIKSIENTINKVIRLAIYYDKAEQICELIKEKYNDCSDGLYLSIDKNNIDNSFLYRISLSKWCTPCYTSIHIWENSIQDNINNKIYVDILNDDNKTLIIEFISRVFDYEIKKYNQWLIEKEEIEKIREEEIRVQQEKLLEEIEKEKLEYINLLKKVVNVFDNNKDKIVKYQIDFEFNNDINLLYFKDYRGLEFIVYSNKSYLHRVNSIKRSYHNNFHHYYEGNCNLIKIELSLEDDIYIMETNDSYEIKNYINQPNYQFPKYLINPKINLSFRDIGCGTKHLPRYDFLNATNKLNDLSKKISAVKYDFVNNFYEINQNKIYTSIDITDEAINDEIYKILYPVIYIANKNTNGILNIKCNVDFTIEDEQRKPWLIKEFIQTLSKFDINNVCNII